MATQTPKDENLHRFVTNSPGFWDSEQGRPTSALFKKNPNGVSVDYEGGRNKDDISYY